MLHKPAIQRLDARKIEFIDLRPRPARRENQVGVEFVPVDGLYAVSASPESILPAL